MGGFSIYYILIVLVAVMIFFSWRSNKKRAEDQRNLQNAMQPGARVMLTSGIFGTIEAIGDQQAVVELAPGLAITVVKQALAKVLTEADEEFEYTDDDNVIEASDNQPELTAGGPVAEQPAAETPAEGVGDEPAIKETAEQAEN